MNRFRFEIYVPILEAHFFGPKMWILHNHQTNSCLLHSASTSQDHNQNSTKKTTGSFEHETEENANNTGVYKLQRVH